MRDLQDLIKETKERMSEMGGISNLNSDLQAMNTNAYKLRSGIRLYQVQKRRPE